MAITHSCTYMLSDYNKKDSSYRRLTAKSWSDVKYILEFTNMRYSKNTIDNSLFVCISDLNTSKDVLEQYGKPFPYVIGILQMSRFFENAHLIKIIAEMHLMHKNWLISQGLPTKELPF